MNNVDGSTGVKLNSENFSILLSQATKGKKGKHGYLGTTTVGEERKIKYFQNEKDLTKDKGYEKLSCSQIKSLADQMILGDLEKSKSLALVPEMKTMVRNLNKMGAERDSKMNATSLKVGRFFLNILSKCSSIAVIGGAIGILFGDVNGRIAHLEKIEKNNLAMKNYNSFNIKLESIVSRYKKEQNIEKEASILAGTINDNLKPLTQNELTQFQKDCTREGGNPRITLKNMDSEVIIEPLEKNYDLKIDRSDEENQAIRDENFDNALKKVDAFFASDPDLEKNALKDLLLAVANQTILNSLSFSCKVEVLDKICGSHTTDIASPTLDITILDRKADKFLKLHAMCNLEIKEPASGQVVKTIKLTLDCDIKFDRSQQKENKEVKVENFQWNYDLNKK